MWFVENNYGSAGNGGTARKYTGGAAGTWSIPSFNLGTNASVAVDYNQCASAGACHVLFIEIGGPSSQHYSIDGGANWIAFGSGTVTTTSSDVPWVARTINNLGNQFGGGLSFDNSGHAYTGSEGVFWFTPTTTPNGTQTMTSQTAGIEEYETNLIVASPSGLIVSGWDVGCFVLSQPYNTFPGDTQHTCAQTVPQFWHSFGLDWLPGSPNTFVSLADNTGRGGGYVSYSAITTNAGASWTSITPPPAVATYGLTGGCIAMSSTTNFLWAGSDGAGGYAPPQYTTNGGTTWNPIVVPGTVEILTTTASSAIGSTVLTFASIPSWVAANQAAVYDMDNLSAIFGTVYVRGKTSTTLTIDTGNPAAVIPIGHRIVVTAGGWPFVSYGMGGSKQCTADKVNAGTFYLYNFNAGGGDAVVKCTSGGASCAMGARPGTRTKYPV